MNIITINFVLKYSEKQEFIFLIKTQTIHSKLNKINKTFKIMKIFHNSKFILISTKSHFSLFKISNIKIQDI